MRLGRGLGCQVQRRPTPPGRGVSSLGHDYTFQRRACLLSALQNSALLPVLTNPQCLLQGCFAPREPQLRPRPRGLLQPRCGLGARGDAGGRLWSSRLSLALSDAFRSAGIPVLQGLIGSGLFLEGLVCGLTLPDVPVSLQTVVASLCGSCLNRSCLLPLLTLSSQNTSSP